MPPFDPGADFDIIAADLGFPSANVTFAQINVDTGVANQTASAPAFGRTTDNAAIGVAGDGSLISRSKRLWVKASLIPWLLKPRDTATEGTTVREIGSVSLVGFDKLYVVETHAVTG